MDRGEKIEVAFMGVGHPHSGPWARAVASVPGVRLLGAYDPDPDRAAAFAGEHGGEALDAERALADDVAAVVVDGRVNQLADLALRALAAGKPVLLEKPGGMTADELARIAAAASDAGVVVQLGYFLRYADSVAEAKRALAAGELGTVSLARIHAAMPRRAWEEMGAWFRDPTNITSIFQEDACHVVDIALHLFGQPAGVVALRAAGAFAASVKEDALAAVLDYGRFLVAIDFTAQEANPWVENWRLEIFGTDATLRGGVRPSWLERFDEGGGWRAVGSPRPTDQGEVSRQGNEDDAMHYRRGAAAFLAAVREGAPSPVGGAAGLAVFRVVEAIGLAADRRAYVALDGNGA